jgi:pimeloyl-ACP methyl ester carboxylesterase
MSLDQTPRRVTVTTPDGVEIVGAAQGEGPGLVLVYGAMMEQTGWSRLLPHLQPERTLYTYDRRGRGESGDAQAYAVEREVDDLISFVESMPEPRDLFGHSSGALLALHAMQRGLQVRRLVLYEPPLAAVRTPRLRADLPGEIEALIAQGDRDGALDLFFRDGMDQPAEDVQRLRNGPRWQDQRRYVQTGAYDVRITGSFVLEPDRLARIDVPVRFLCGSESPWWMREGVETRVNALDLSTLPAGSRGPCPR